MDVAPGVRPREGRRAGEVKFFEFVAQADACAQRIRDGRRCVEFKPEALDAEAAALAEIGLKLVNWRKRKGVHRSARVPGSGRLGLGAGGECCQQQGRGQDGGIYRVQ